MNILSIENFHRNKQVALKDETRFVAERNILAAMLLDSEFLHWMTEAGDMVRWSKYFRDERHRLIYDAMCIVHLSSKLVDLITVGNQLRIIGKLESAGGASYIAGLLVD